jgi:hypothetical protein
MGISTLCLRNQGVDQWLIFMSKEDLISIEWINNRTWKMRKNLRFRMIFPSARHSRSVNENLWTWAESSGVIGPLIELKRICMSMENTIQGLSHFPEHNFCTCWHWSRFPKRITSCGTWADQICLPSYTPETNGQVSPHRMVCFFQLTQWRTSLSWRIVLAECWPDPHLVIFLLSRVIISSIRTCTCSVWSNWTWPIWMKIIYYLT